MSGLGNLRPVTCRRRWSTFRRGVGYVESPRKFSRCVTNGHHRCPLTGPRQKTFAATRRTRRLDAIPVPVRASFGAFGGIENGYAQAIDRYRDFAENFRYQPKSSERGSEGGSGNFGQRKRPYKSWTCRPSKTVSAVLRVRCSTN